MHCKIDNRECNFSLHPGLRVEKQRASRISVVWLWAQAAADWSGATFLRPVFFLDACQKS
jgi:hypothetical protein